MTPGGLADIVGRHGRRIAKGFVEIPDKVWEDFQRGRFYDDFVMIRPEMPGYDPGIVDLREVGFLEPDRERLYGPRGEGRHERDDRAGIQTAA